MSVTRLDDLDNVGRGIEQVLVFDEIRLTLLTSYTIGNLITHA